MEGSVTTEGNLSSAELTVVGSGKYHEVNTWIDGYIVDKPIYGWNLTIDTTNYDDGKHTFLLTVRDTAGNLYDYAWHVTIDNRPDWINTTLIGVVPALVVAIVVYVGMRQKMKAQPEEE